MKKFLYYSILFVAICSFVLILNFQYEHPETYKIKKFSYLKQPDGITCGPTSVTMLLNSYGKNVTLDEVKLKTKTQWFIYKDEPIGMTSPDYIPVAINSFGLHSKIFYGNIEKLKYFVSKGRPCVVLLRSGVQTWHWVVAIGYDKDNITIADPGPGKDRIMKLSNFQSSWDFTTDMNGKSVSQKCKICNGTGLWLDFNLGPLSRCEICNGTGFADDSLVMLLKFAQVHPYTMVIPKESIPKD